jgi:hypothetical protein
VCCHGMLHEQVWMGEDESIAGLKAKLQALTGVPAPAQKLMFKKLLQDTDIIRDTIKVSCSPMHTRSHLHAAGCTQADSQRRMPGNMRTQRHVSALCRTGTKGQIGLLCCCTRHAAVCEAASGVRGADM